ncbi:serine carboxypeptidase-like 17 isoform X1 [Lactuca sativa]|uniref:serine carboxypeptidase-like 17 isoform X1 n=1 Tax=Lactuca sativa TaxID=4236 RepID=UPI000CAFE016|nr:serine carboxypeptidase-like 17 isoform X1 [Lactuca sativa]
MKPRSQSHLQPLSLFNGFNIRFLLFYVFILLVSLEVIKSGFVVKKLPGWLGDLPFTLETGYVGVGESNDVQLFYYFIESEGNPENDPLILWLTGGPGCSALSSILYEIGPFTFNYANSTLKKPVFEIKPHSWTKVANIIFLDQPAGTGFSYAKSRDAYITNDTLSSMHGYDFLRKWLVDHPKFLNNPFYLGGESYMGIVGPMIIQEIYKGNEVGEGPKINIKGYMLGNPLTDTNSDYNSRIPFVHRVGLLSDEIYKSTKKNCHGEYFNIVDLDNSRCINDLQVVDKCIGRINKPQILEPACDTSNTLKYDLFGRKLRSLDKASMDMWSLTQVQIQGCRDDHYLFSYVWANRRDVREALHIDEEFDKIEWVRCNETLFFYIDKEPISYTHNVLNTVAYHRYLANKNCRALVYSGDHDMVHPYLGTMKWIESLNFLVVNDWRPWFVDKQVAGYTMKYSHHEYNLTFATLKGGGHTAPEYKPKECFNMVKMWLANDAL